LEVLAHPLSILLRECQKLAFTNLKSSSNISEHFRIVMLCTHFLSGPLPNTVVDFWQMVVEAQSTLVVMVTPLVERGRTKCHQYWPAVLQTLELGHMHVTCTKEQVEPTGSFVFREFRLTNLEVIFLTLSFLPKRGMVSL
jgi:hypothetical protein